MEHRHVITHTVSYTSSRPMHNCLQFLVHDHEVAPDQIQHDHNADLALGEHGDEYTVVGYSLDHYTEE